MKTVVAFTILFLAWATVAGANELTFQDNSDIEDGFTIEMLSMGTWIEVAALPAKTIPAPSPVSFTDARTEGVYRVAAFLNVPGGGRLLSAYSNTAAKLNAPVNVTVK